MAQSTGSQATSWVARLDYGSKAEAAQMMKTVVATGTGRRLVYPKPVYRSRTKSWCMWVQGDRISLSKIVSNRVQYISKLNDEPKIFSIPDDPSADTVTGLQRQILTKLDAYRGWDITKGDSNIVIGVLDTGFDVDFAEMQNYAVHRADPVNGIDDDGNGLVDDYLGWDFGNGDADVRPTNNHHGTNVASISSAKTNNGVGMAGIGWRCSYLPIKVFGPGFGGYGGILYAADRGCRVINLSWGGIGYPSQFEQDVIDYAVQDKGCVVVAAAGNTPGVHNFYPASYAGVISVGFTNLDDGKNYYSTLADSVDVVAPGNDIIGITAAGQVGVIGGGSSFSAPMVAGLAGLVLSAHPTYTPQQVRARILAGADVVDTLAANRDFVGRMGVGRINIRRTLSAEADAYVEAKAVSLVGRQTGDWPRGVQVEMQVVFGCDLGLPGLVSFNLSSPDTGLHFLGSPVSLTIQEGQVRASGPIRCFYSGSATAVPVRVSYGYGATAKQRLLYVSRQTFYRDVYTDSARLTVSGTGRLGFVDDQYYVGSGLRQNGRNLVGELGLMIARDVNHVVSCVAGDRGRDRDFSQSADVYYDSSGRFAEAQYVDTAARSRAVGVAVDQKVWTLPGDSVANTIFSEYTLTRTGGLRNVDTLNVALLADWDLDNYIYNRARYDSALVMSYALNADSQYVGQVQLTPEQKPIFYAIDKVYSSANGNINVMDGYSLAEKWQSLSSGVGRLSAGGQGGTDVAIVHGAGLPFDSGRVSGRVAMAWVVAKSLPALQTQAMEAKRQYRKMRQGVAYTGPQIIRFCGTDSAVLPLPPGRWVIYNRWGLKLFEGQQTARLAPIAGTFYIANVDSVPVGMFAGPGKWCTVQAGGAIASNFLPDSLPINSVLSLQDSLVDSYTISLLTGPSTTVIGSSLSQLLSQAGMWRVCKRGTPPTSCGGAVCDSLRVYIPTIIQTRQASQLIITPNPARDEVRITGLEVNTQVLLMDGLGRVVGQYALLPGDNRLSLKGMQPGIYTIAAGGKRGRLVVCR